MHWSSAVEILVFLALVPSETNSNSLKIPNKNCTNVDVRNSASNLDKVANCTVIEGYLRIVLIENATKQDFINRTYPMLTEVTGFVMFVRVGGLQSISSLFPNLSVIRGSTLFLDYGLVIYKMPNLMEISLVKLRILRGGAAVLRNPALCWVNKLVWEKVAPAGPDFFLIPGPNDTQCANCHEGCSSCWSDQICQEDQKTDNCHEECLGGCTGPGPEHCTVCLHLLYEGTCVKSCPEGSFERIGRECITAEMCENFHTLVDQGDKWFTWNNTCRQFCPPGMEKKDKGCEPCPNGTCPIECDSIFVESLASAQKLKGCNRIRGSLVISYRTGKPEVVAKELEENLGSIEEISGSLKIVWSNTLQNLNFLRNLTVIKGKLGSAEKHDNDYSFIVKDNENLIKLWDWDKRPAGRHFEIRKGRIFFHNNDKLCMHHIEELIRIANLTEVTDRDVAKESNGGKFACQNASLVVEVSERYFDRVVLTIRDPKPPANQSYPPRYAIYYVEGERPEAEMSLPFYNNPCSDSQWKMTDSAVEEDGSDEIRLTLTNLKPYTNYTYVVRKYTFQPSEGVTRTPLQYVQTLSSTPSCPSNVHTIANSSSEITIYWDPPVYPNGKIEQYVVEWVMQEDDEDFILSGRNFCDSKMSPGRATTTVRPQVKTLPRNPHQPAIAKEEDICDIPMGSLLSSSFGRDGLQTCDSFSCDVTQKNIGSQSSTSRRSRSTEEIIPHSVETSTAAPAQPNLGQTVTGQTFLEVSGLRHYTSYLIYITACNSVSNCSEKSIEVVRTKPILLADKIEENYISLEVKDRYATLSWRSPSDPNGLVVSYHIELRRVEIGNHKPIVECEPAVVGRGQMMNITLGPYEPGKYTLRVRAVSLYNEGPFSSPRSFYIGAPMSHGPIIIFLILTGSFLIVGLISVYYYRHYLIKKHKVLVATVNPEYGTEAELSALKAYTEDEWELPRDNVVIGKDIKEGNFGMVKEGTLLPEGRRVAIKTCKETFSERENIEFLAEAAIMKEFKGAPHIVNLIGVVSRGKPPLVVMELMALGDLKTFLRLSRDSPQYPSPHALRIIMMAAQIADGMAFLEAKKFVHRDLAARNCMVSENLTVKIGDFGMTRDIYETDYYRKGNKGLLPIRWMSPESLNDGVFTTHSDVWSYGVVLWEMVTLASQPYQGMANEQVLQYVVQGNKLETPIFCPAALKPIMAQCWKWKPKLRPSFFTILSELDPFLDDEFRKISFYHSSDSEDVRNQLLQSLQESKALMSEADYLLSTTSNEETSAQSVNTSSLLD